MLTAIAFSTFLSRQVSQTASSSSCFHFAPNLPNISDYPCQHKNTLCLDSPGFRDATRFLTFYVSLLYLSSMGLFPTFWIWTSLRSSLALCTYFYSFSLYSFKLYMLTIYKKQWWKQTWPLLSGNLHPFDWGRQKINMKITEQKITNWDKY